jgi:nucleotide-binding universal stress UspA family protein
MSQPEAVEGAPEPFRRIALATDLGPGAADLFASGLALALKARAELTLLHIVAPEHKDMTWGRLPTVRELLERWGHLAQGASAEDFEALGVRVIPIERPPTRNDVVTALLHTLTSARPDLLVLGTHARSGFARLANQSVAEPVTRALQRLTLLVPDRARALVDTDTGELRLRRVLVPVDEHVPLQPVVDALERLLTSIGAGPVSFVLVHVGRPETIPAVRLPRRVDWSWRTDVRSGAVVEQILRAEIDNDVDLVAMPTFGHEGLLDALVGSPTERVIRRSTAPVLAVPPE